MERKSTPKNSMAGSIGLVKFDRLIEMAKAETTSEEDLRNLLNLNDIAIDSYISLRHIKDHGLIEKLSLHSAWQVRRRIALNSSTPLNILLKLATDIEWSVRQAVSLNRNISNDIKEILRKDRNILVNENVT